LFDNSNIDSNHKLTRQDIKFKINRYKVNVKSRLKSAKGEVRRPVWARHKRRCGGDVPQSAVFTGSDSAKDAADCRLP